MRIDRILYTISFLIIAIWASSSKKKSDKPGPKSKINFDMLPPLNSVLEELQLSQYFKQFVRMGITETRFLLKLSSMDFQLMMYEWDNFSEENVLQLKEKIQELTKKATIIELPPREDLIHRSKLSYGRIYIPLAVKAIEYQQASFGGFPPFGPLHLRLAVGDQLECDADQYQNTNSSSQIDYEGDIIVVQRGVCSFLQKALIAKVHHNASGMLVINNVDLLESPASGVGIDKNITEELLSPIANFFVATVSNNSFCSLEQAIKVHGTKNDNNNHNNHHDGSVRLLIQIVPLSCKAKKSCQPVTLEEQQLRFESTWGQLLLDSPFLEKTETIEFITSHFGGSLPANNTRLTVQLASPIDACSNMTTIAAFQSESEIISTSEPFLLIAARGGCSFDLKTWHAQNLGATMLMVYDPKDEPLQRMGGSNPTVGHLGIPSALTTKRLADVINKVKSLETLRVTVEAAMDDIHQLQWLELLSSKWKSSSNPRETFVGMKTKYSDANEISLWINRRIEELDQTTPSLKDLEL
jgi:hypothetical protein